MNAYKIFAYEKVFKTRVETPAEEDDSKDEVTEKPAPEENKDDIPKTGDNNYVGIAVLAILFSSIAIVGISKKKC